MLITPTSAPATLRAFHCFLRWRAFQAVLAILILLHLFAFPPHQTPTTDLEQVLQATPSNLSFTPEAPRKIGRVFVAALLKDNEDILKGGWSEAVVNLTRALGPENVWVSIHESGSQDGTKKQLQLLDLRLKEMGAGHKINVADVGEDMHKIIPHNGPGWITVEGRPTMRRIPFLAELRNMNLGHLTALAAKGIIFDKILFLNDIIFTSDDALELLHTHRGDYAAACGFDYARPYPALAFYDQFATRDSNGQELVSLYHPYFAEGRSRDALVGGSPVPVKSCWSGIAAFDAAPFQDLARPLRFRAVNDSLAEYHLEASECCLIHYDNPLSGFKGVWMNPKVRVGYNTVRYDDAHRPAHWPSTAETTVGRFMDLWARIRHLKPRPEVIDQRFEEWSQESIINEEVGTDCLVNKIMVVSEKGQWREVKERWWFQAR
jgi:Cryptococcal mannosyltransferase 1